MLRVTAGTNAAGAKKYFGESLSRDDYYSRGQDIAGLWGGKAAERLGLSGQVDQASYFALCDNLDPRTGEQLTPRQKDNRRVGYDFTFSAPKAVSVLYETSGDERIIEAFRQSVKESMTEIEAEMKTRVREAGKDEDRTTGNLVYAEFVHFTARPVGGNADPHLHAHCYAFNSTWDETEARWKAGQFGDLKRDAHYYEAAFHARLASRLNELGYGTERKANSFTLAGVDQSIVDKFSQRRNVIEAKAEELGITSAKGKHAIGRKGREAKVEGLTKEDLRNEWNSRLTPEERASMGRVAKGLKGKLKGTAETAVDHAIAHSFERDSVVAEKRLKAEALRYGVGSVLPEEVDKATAGNAELRRREKEGQRFVTTISVLKEEEAMLTFARKGRGACAPFGNGMDGLADLSEEQANAGRHVITSKDRVVGIEGGAGTGKTHLMKATIEAIEQGNVTPGAKHQKVFVFAPSSEASRGVLRDKEGFANATTTAELLINRELQEKVKGQVLWIDEAGLLGSKEMNGIFQIAEKQNARVILSGDYRQHSSVGRCDSFRLLQAEAGVQYAQLKSIRRQKKDGYKKAVASIAKGTAKDAAKGFEQLEAIGSIIEAEGLERKGLLVRDYLEAVDDIKAGKIESALVIAPTHAEGRDVTGMIREALKMRGDLGEKERIAETLMATNFTDAEKKDARNYEQGQVIQFHQHVGGFKVKRASGIEEKIGGFKRGEKVEVLRQAEMKEGEVVVKRKDGSRAYLPLIHSERFGVYRHVDTGFAAGDKIRITANGYVQAPGKLELGKKGLSIATAKQERLNNGATYTITGFTQRGDFKLNNGWVLPKDYGHFTHGYVDTSHASQGKTVDRVFIAVGEESLSAANRKQFYVSVSRGKELAKIYTEDKEALKRAIQKSADRLSATELMKEQVKEPAERKPMGKVIDMKAFLAERHRVLEYMKERARTAYESVKERSPWRDRVQQPGTERSVGYGR